MSTRTHFHRVASVKAEIYNRSEWLEISDDKGNHLSIFMPFHVAEAIQEAWEEAQAETGGAKELSAPLDLVRERISQAYRGDLS